MRKGMVAVLTVFLMVFGFTAFAAEESGGNPDQALQKLKDGHARFVDGKSTHPDATLARMKETADKGQKPFATVIGCSDSRVPLELIFDQGVGDIFVVRVAGNVCDTDEIGSIEYGAGHLKTPLIVVLGHTKCGAVTAVATKAEVGGSIPLLVDNITPAVENAKAANPGKDEATVVAAAIRANVFQSIQDLLTHSEEVRELVHEGKVKVVGALYAIEDGKIEWLGEHPKQKELLAEAKPHEAGKSETKHETKPEAKAEAKTEAKPEVKHEEKK